MALVQSPSIVTNGLAFYYDMSNTQKSWKGAPTENLVSLAGSDSAIQRSGTAYPFYNVGLTSLIQSRWTASNNVLSMSFEGRRNLVNGGTGDGGDGYPVAYVYFTDWSWAAAVGISTYDWSYTTQTFTMPNPAGKGINFDVYHMNAGNPGLSFSRNHQVEFGSRSTPFVNGTRTNTQAITDLVGNNTVTVNSLTYASDGTFSFNGSTNHIITTNTGMSHGTGNFTYSCWANFAGLPVVGTFFENGFYTNGILIRFETNIIRIYAQYSATTYTNAFSFIPTIGQWYHLVITRVGDNLLLYSNGILLSTITFGSNINVVPSNNLMFIGMSQHQAGQCFNGQIASAQVYNRALSAAEVQQNFNAQRGRYSI
jgi:hypothetical protein